MFLHSILEKDGISAMPKSQTGGPISSPSETDTNLQDYSQGIQEALNELYVGAHDHKVLSENPGTTAGAIETISIVDTGTSVYLVVKTRRGWFQSPAFTAI